MITFPGHKFLVNVEVCYFQGEHCASSLYPYLTVLGVIFNGSQVMTPAPIRNTWRVMIFVALCTSRIIDYCPLWSGWPFGFGKGSPVRKALPRLDPRSIYSFPSVVPVRHPLLSWHFLLSNQTFHISNWWVHVGRRVNGLVAACFGTQEA